MTPKEKAKELFDKMIYQIEWNAQPSTVKGVAKQCATIAVDEVMSYCPAEQIGYWKEVSQNIEAL